MQDFFYTCKSADVQHWHRACFFKSQIKLLHHKVGKVVSCHGKQQLVFIHTSGRIHQDHTVRSIRFSCKCTCRVGCGQRTVFTQTKTQVPGHTGHAALHQGTAAKDTFQHLTCQFRHIGCRIFLYQRFQGRFETFGITGLYISQRIQEHKFRHQGCQRIFNTDIAEIPTHGNSIACQITIIGLLIDRILYGIHHTYIIFIIRIRDGNRIILIREGIDHLRLVLGSQRGITRTERHQIDLVITLQAVRIIRKTTFQFFKSLDRQRQILQFIFIDHRHIIQSVLNNYIRGIHIFLRER